MASSLFMLAFGLGEAGVQSLLEQAFYPALLLIFVIASLGVPIPEDIPLIAAGIILKTQPQIATWTGTLLISAVGIMSGDTILYSLGRRWGPDVFSHRSVRWLISPARLRLMARRFHRWGVWFCFFGRLVMGVRAAMCLTAGVTRFPFWKFFLADLAGACMSIPVFVGLGYGFAHMMPTLETYIVGVRWGVGIVVGLVVAAIVIYEWRHLKTQRRKKARRRENLRIARLAAAARARRSADPGHAVAAGSGQSETS